MPQLSRGPHPLYPRQGKRRHTSTYWNLAFSAVDSHRLLITVFNQKSAQQSPQEATSPFNQKPSMCQSVTYGTVLRTFAVNIYSLPNRKLSIFAVNPTINWGVHTANPTARFLVAKACCQTLRQWRGVLLSCCPFLLWWPVVIA